MGRESLKGSAFPLSSSSLRSSSRMLELVLTLGQLFFGPVAGLLLLCHACVFTSSATNGSILQDVRIAGAVPPT